MSSVPPEGRRRPPSPWQPPAFWFQWICLLGTCHTSVMVFQAAQAPYVKAQSVASEKQASSDSGHLSHLVALLTFYLLWSMTLRHITGSSSPFSLRNPDARRQEGLDSGHTARQECQS